MSAAKIAVTPGRHDGAMEGNIDPPHEGDSNQDDLDDVAAARRAPDPFPDRYRGGVWGTRLRHAALAVLMAAYGEPLSVVEILHRVRANHVVRVGVTRKDLADALRYECRRGRAARAYHGHYVIGTLAPRTRRRILHHERQLVAGDQRAVAHALAQYLASARGRDAATSTEPRPCSAPASSDPGP
jgi:hypothetical protein